MVAQYLLQGIVEQVGSRVVGGACLALVGVYACHEVSLRILWQLLNDVYRLSVLALGVYDVHCFVLAYQHSAVANLTTHLAVEWCVVEHEFIECVLLLCHLAVAQYVAFVFSVVVAYEVLLALAQLGPVAVFNGSGVARSCLLLLHLLVKLFLVNAESVFAADEFSEVERESVGVEQAECLCAVEHGLAFGLNLLHGVRQHVDAVRQRAQERFFLFLYHLGYQFALCGKFGISLAHLVYQRRHELKHECLFLVEEGVCVSYGAAQYAAYNVACLCVARQLAVGY